MGDRLQRAANLIDGHGSAEPHDQVRPAGELDSQRNAARQDHEQAGGDDHGRQHRGLPPPAEKIEIRGEDLHS
jgi:hypothetical protein